MSWNTIDVPLETGWQCTLTPTLQYDDLMRWGRGYYDLSARRLYPRGERNFWHSSWNARAPSEVEKAELWEKARLRQLADDQATFARLFRPAWDLRTITGGNALRDIKTFLRDSLSIAHWNMPQDNADIRRILCKAVADNSLVPVINRDYEGRSRVALPDPVPQHWPATGGGGYAFPQKVISYPEFVALQRANGEISDSLKGMASAGLSAVVEPMMSLRTAASNGGGFDWLGTVETVAGAMFGSGAGSGDGDNTLDEDFSGAVSGAATPLSDAQPFEYIPEQVDGDSFDIAKTPNLGDPGTWYTNPGSGQMRLYGGDGKPVLDLDFDHVHNGLQPHAHNWTNGVRDGGDDVVPFSPWSP